MSNTQITAADLYKYQNQLAKLEGKEDRSYEESVEAARLRDLVWEGQDKFNGEIFRIADVKVKKLADKIEKMGKRAGKIGVSAPTFTDTGEREDQNIGTEKVKTIWTWAYVAVNGVTPVVNGWSFIATLQHEKEGTIIRQVPALRLPEAQRERFQQHLDALAQYRNAKPVCDHCNKIRARKDTYVVVHEDGTLKQVGTNCLADFLGGLSPQQAAKGFEYIFRAIDEARSVQSGGFTGITVDPTYDTLEYLVHVAWAYRTRGWLPRSKAYDSKRATADVAAGNMSDAERQVRDRMGIPMWEDPSEKDIEVAKATINYIRNEWVNDTDFGHNLTTVIADDEVKRRNFGLAAAAVMVYKRDTEKKIEREKAQNSANNEWVANVKDRLDLTLTVTGIKVIDGNYGISYLTSMVDEDGHKFKWFGSYELNEGTTYSGKWTIKKHDEWNGIKSTLVTRPAKLEEA